MISTSAAQRSGALQTDRGVTKPQLSGYSLVRLRRPPTLATLNRISALLMRLLDIISETAEVAECSDSVQHCSYCAACPETSPTIIDANSVALLLGDHRPLLYCVM
jgi:hypothetical protein